MRPLRFGLMMSLVLVGSVATIGVADARGGFGGGRGGVRAAGISHGFVQRGFARRGFVDGAFTGRRAFPRGPGFGPGYGSGPGSIGFGPGYGNSVEGWRGRWDRGFGREYGRGRDVGGDSYGSYGGVLGAPGYIGGPYGRGAVPAIAGIRASAVRPPAFYSIGAGPGRSARAGFARRGGGPLVADSASAGGPSGVVGTGPQIIRLP